MDRAMPPIARLAFLLGDMNEAEQEVLLCIAERLHEGRTTYGPLDPNDGRDWKQERREELLDALIYDAIDVTKVRYAAS